jgi:hypothetical protein
MIQSNLTTNKAQHMKTLLLTLLTGTVLLIGGFAGSFAGMIIAGHTISIDAVITHATK